MKVFDRYIGQEVALPEHIEEGRFRLLRPTLLNGGIDLVRNDVLLSDGREHCFLGEEAHQFEDSGCHAGKLLDEPTEAQLSIVRKAMELLAARNDCDKEVLFSPLLPPEMADALELNELDEVLQEIISRGHLDEIVRRPRYSMKYESELVHVSRVRRTATGALDRLASRSEDWHRRTISAVLPKRLLALLSDDDWSIYENKVFARLLDRLEQYLRRRLAEAEELQRVFNDALELDSAEWLDFRLRNKLCKLWGEATDSSEAVTRNAIDESKRVIEILRSAKRKIGLLRHCDLYNKVPRSARVPTELRNTNILNHDQHYRHLKTLWHLHQQSNESRAKTPEEVFRTNQRDLRDFACYLQTMIRRVLRDIHPLSPLDPTNSFVFAGSSGCLLSEKHEVTLRLGRRELVFVPVLGSTPQINGLKADGSGRIIVSRISAIDGSEFSSLDSLAKGRVFSVNPLDFYGEEKLRVILEHFLWFPVFKSYGAALDRLPSDALEWFSNHGIGMVEKTRWHLLCPLDAGERTLLDEWLLYSGLNPDTKEKISTVVQHTTALGHCRHCGHPGTFVKRDGGFKAECVSCNTDWGIYSNQGKRQARMSTRDSSSRKFAYYGSWFIEFMC